MGFEHRQVLVLNRLWQAINVCEVPRATALLYTGHASVIHEEAGDYYTYAFAEWLVYSEEHPGGDVLRSVSHAMRIPKVILLGNYDRFPRHDVRLSRENVYIRDDYACQYCQGRPGKAGLNIDHVQPRSRGGATEWTNVVTSCIPCNTRKADRTPAEARMALVAPPKKPSWRPLLEYKRSLGDQEAVWGRFILGVS